MLRHMAIDVTQETMLAGLEVGERAVEEAPARLGRYLVVEQIGAGGMGVVYAAYDPDLDRKVAVKLLRPTSELDTTDATSGRDRLLREAQAMAKLSHPNVVPVFDVGAMGEDVFVAMDFIDGHTLRAWLAARERAVDEILAAFAQAGRGLAAAHAAGLVHRDFKPDNVLVSEGRDGQRRVQVLDFGLAKPVDREDRLELSTGAHPVASLAGEDSLRADLTQTGAIMGTPAYMAPEQHRGQPTDARTDQFAFCVALWEALYRSRPFAGEDLMTLGFNVCRHRIQEPSADAKVPSRLQPILRRGLAADPGERHPDMGALLGALEPPPPSRIPNLILGAVGVGGLIAATVFALRPAPPAPAPAPPPPVCIDLDRALEGVWDGGRRVQLREHFAAIEAPWAASMGSIAVERIDGWAEAWVAARVDACEAHRVRGEQSEALATLRYACLDRRLSEADSQIAALAEADQGLASRADEVLDELPVLAPCADATGLQAVMPLPEDETKREQIAELRETMARSRASLLAGAFDEAVASSKGLVERAETIGWPPLVAEAAYREGANQLAKGNDEQGVPLLEEGVWLALESHHDQIAYDLLEELVFAIGYTKGDHATGRRWADLLVALEARNEASPRRRVAALNQLGMLEYKAGEHAAGAAYLREAIEIHEAAQLDELAIRSTLNTLGGIELATGEYEAAKRHFERSLELHEQAKGPDHPAVAFPLNNLALAHERLTEYDRAIELLERTLALLEAAHGEDHPNVGLVEMNIGGMLVLAGRVEEAGPRHDRALRILESKLGADHQIVGRALTMRGEYDLARNDLDAAQASLERGLHVREKALGKDHPDVALTAMWLGRVAQRRGRYADAATWLERALKLLEKGEPDPVDRGMCRMYLAQVRQARGRPQAEVDALVAQAREDFEAGGPTGARKLTELDAWVGGG